MRVICPDCKARFDLDIAEYDEGDYLNCPECNLELLVVVKDGKPKLRIARDKDLDDTAADFDEFYENE